MGETSMLEELVRERAELSSAQDAAIESFKSDIEILRRLCYGDLPSSDELEDALSRLGKNGPRLLWASVKIRFLDKELERFGLKFWPPPRPSKPRSTTCKCGAFAEDHPTTSCDVFLSKTDTAAAASPSDI